MFRAKVKHIFFDLDHTLWDFEKNSKLTFKIIFDKHGIPFDLDSFIEVYKPINFKYWNMYRKNMISSENLRHERLKEVFSILGYPYDRALIDLMAEEYINYLSEQIHLFPDTNTVLDYLSEHYELHIITNGFEMIQHKKLKSSKINHYFKTVTTAEGSGYKKPDPRIFDHALTSAKATNRDSLMIGDSLEADIQGAKDFGMHTIYFGKKPNFETLHVEHLSDLKNLL
jgi:putative hydrolase of the HAD superfamily